MELTSFIYVHLALNKRDFQLEACSRAKCRYEFIRSPTVCSSSRIPNVLTMCWPAKAGPSGTTARPCGGTPAIDGWWWGGDTEHGMNEGKHLKCQET